MENPYCNCKLTRAVLGGHSKNSDQAGTYTDSDRLDRMEQRNLLQCSLLSVVFRWRKTLEMMSTVVIDRDSFFLLLLPFEQKQKRFRKRMEDRLLALPKEVDYVPTTWP